MASRSTALVDVLAIFGIGIICLPILLLLLPDFLESRTEARIAMAYSDVLHIRESVCGVTSQRTDATVRDPWGQPYRIVPFTRGGCRVLSSGPNQTSPPGGADEDDIYSDMPTSPVKSILAGKKRQSLTALVVAGGFWLLVAWIYVRWRRRAMA
jgi:hypothetical protein